MKKDYTPPESISFVRLVVLIVEQRHGSDAIADITTHVVGKGEKSRTVLKRAGKPINYIKDSKDSNRWDTAKEAIRQACNTGELTACVRNKDGDKLKISAGYWDALINVKGHDGMTTTIIPNSDSHWYTFDTGLFRPSTEPSYNDRPVYFKEDEARSFLNTLDGKTTTKPTDQKVNQGGRPFADEGNEIADKIAKLKSEGLGYPKILREIRFTKCVQKLKKEKILKSGEVKEEQLYHKVLASIKGKEYTALVGISTDTVKNMIENPTE